VLGLAAFGNVGYLWYNVVGCALVVGLAPAFQAGLRSASPG
jgi:hypothetical protein